jgi:arsenite methyltransferase
MAEPAVTSTGHAQSGTGWLDAHFTACQPEYEAMLRSVGLQSGWQVLDAGCGSGSFLPLMSELVGATGRVTALDLAPENIAAVDHRLVGWRLVCPVETWVGSLAALPFPDDAFDALWCAAVSQYLTDDELMAALAEFRRVVRPGGLVAIKEFNGAVLHFGPTDPHRWWHFAEAAEPVSAQAHGVMRATSLRRWLERAGLVDVSQRTTLAERHAPLRPVERAYIGDFLRYFASVAPQLPLSEDDQAFWRDQLQPDAAASLISQHNFCWCEGHIVALGRVPIPM